MSAAVYARALDLVIQVRGVRGAMLVSRADGLVVAEQLMEGIKGGAVAALASSLAGRLHRAMLMAGLGPTHFWHLQSEQGALVVVPAGGETGLLVVAVADAEVNVGLVRLELLRAAEVVV